MGGILKVKYEIMSPRGILQFAQRNHLTPLYPIIAYLQKLIQI